MKKNTAFLAFLLWHVISYAQIFKSENEDFINFNSKEIKITIGGSTYKGDFKSFTSKKDKREYLIYTYFSRTVIVSLNTPLEKIEENTPDIYVNTIKLVHSSDIKSITKAIDKNGLNNIKNFMIVYESLNSNINFWNCILKTKIID